MNNMPDAFQLLSTLSAISEKYSQIEKNPHIGSDGVTIYPSQIRSIVTIGHNPGINVTELAKSLEITKSSASEFVSKLVKDGLVRKARDVDNSKEVLLFITDKGRRIMEDMDRRHALMFQDLKKMLGTEKDNNLAMVIRVLKRVDYYLDNFLKENV
jgi:DNA-binding MarR family transcriptional regulator